MATPPNFPAPVQSQYLETDSTKRLKKSKADMDVLDRARQARQAAGPGNTGFERFIDMHKEARGPKVLSGKRPGKGWRYTEGPYKGMHPSDANRSAYRMWDSMGEKNRDKFRKKSEGDYAADRYRKLQDMQDEADMARKIRGDMGLPSATTDKAWTDPKEAGKSPGSSKGSSPVNNPNLAKNNEVPRLLQRPAEKPVSMIGGRPASEVLAEGKERVERMRDPSIARKEAIRKEVKVRGSDEGRSGMLMAEMDDLTGTQSATREGLQSEGYELGKKRLAQKRTQERIMANADAGIADARARVGNALSPVRNAKKETRMASNKKDEEEVG